MEKELFQIEAVIDRTIVEGGAIWYQVKWKRKWYHTNNDVIKPLVDILKKKTTPTGNEKFLIVGERSINDKICYWVRKSNSWHDEAEVLKLDHLKVNEYCEFSSKTKMKEYLDIRLKAKYHQIKVEEEDYEMTTSSQDSSCNISVTSQEENELFIDETVDKVDDEFDDTNDVKLITSTSNLITPSSSQLLSTNVNYEKRISNELYQVSNNLIEVYNKTQYDKSNKQITSDSDDKSNENNGIRNMFKCIKNNFLNAGEFQINSSNSKVSSGFQNHDNVLQITSDSDRSNSQITSEDRDSELDIDIETVSEDEISIAQKLINEQKEIMKARKKQKALEDKTPKARTLSIKRSIYSHRERERRLYSAANFSYLHSIINEVNEDHPRGFSPPKVILLENATKTIRGLKEREIQYLKEKDEYTHEIKEKINKLRKYCPIKIVIESDKILLKLNNNVTLHGERYYTKCLLLEHFRSCEKCSIKSNEYCFHFIKELSDLHESEATRYINDEKKWSLKNEAICNKLKKQFQEKSRSNLSITEYRNKVAESRPRDIQYDSTTHLRILNLNVHSNHSDINKQFKSHVVPHLPIKCPDSLLSTNIGNNPGSRSSNNANNPGSHSSCNANNNSTKETYSVKDVDTINTAFSTDSFFNNQPTNNSANKLLKKPDSKYNELHTLNANTEKELFLKPSYVNSTTTQEILNNNQSDSNIDSDCLSEKTDSESKTDSDASLSTISSTMCKNQIDKILETNLAMINKNTFSHQNFTLNNITQLNKAKNYIHVNKTPLSVDRVNYHTSQPIISTQSSHTSKSVELDEQSNALQFKKDNENQGNLLGQCNYSYQKTHGNDSKEIVWQPLKEIPKLTAEFMLFIMNIDASFCFKSISVNQILIRRLNNTWSNLQEYQTKDILYLVKELNQQKVTMSVSKCKKTSDGVSHHYYKLKLLLIQGILSYGPALIISLETPIQLLRLRFIFDNKHYYDCILTGSHKFHDIILCKQCDNTTTIALILHLLSQAKKLLDFRYEQGKDLPIDFVEKNILKFIPDTHKPSGISIDDLLVTSSVDAFNNLLKSSSDISSNSASNRKNSTGDSENNRKNSAININSNTTDSLSSHKSLQKSYKVGSDKIGSLKTDSNLDRTSIAETIQNKTADSITNHSNFTRTLTTDFIQNKTVTTVTTTSNDLQVNSCVSQITLQINTMPKYISIQPKPAKVSEKSFDVQWQLPSVSGKLFNLSAKVIDKTLHESEKPFSLPAKVIDNALSVPSQQINVSEKPFSLPSKKIDKTLNVQSQQIIVSEKPFNLSAKVIGKTLNVQSQQINLCQKLFNLPAKLSNTAINENKKPANIQSKQSYESEKPINVHSRQLQENVTPFNVQLKHSNTNGQQNNIEIGRVNYLLSQLSTSDITQTCENIPIEVTYTFNSQLETSQNNYSDEQSDEDVSEGASCENIHMEVTNTFNMQLETSQNDHSDEQSDEDVSEGASNVERTQSQLCEVVQSDATDEQSDEDVSEGASNVKITQSQLSEVVQSGAYRSTKASNTSDSPVLNLTYWHSKLHNSNNNHSSTTSSNDTSSNGIATVSVTQPDNIPFRFSTILNQPVLVSSTEPPLTVVRPSYDSTMPLEQEPTADSAENSTKEPVRKVLVNNLTLPIQFENEVSKIHTTSKTLNDISLVQDTDIQKGIHSSSDNEPTDNLANKTNISKRASCGNIVMKNETPREETDKSKTLSSSNNKSTKEMTEITTTLSSNNSKSTNEMTDITTSLSSSNIKSTNKMIDMSTPLLNKSKKITANLADLEQVLSSIVCNVKQDRETEISDTSQMSNTNKDKSNTGVLKEILPKNQQKMKEIPYQSIALPSSHIRATPKTKGMSKTLKALSSSKSALKITDMSITLPFNYSEPLPKTKDVPSIPIKLPFRQSRSMSEITGVTEISNTKGTPDMSIKLLPNSKDLKHNKSAEINDMTKSLSESSVMNSNRKLNTTTKDTTSSQLSIQSPAELNTFKNIVNNTWNNRFPIQNKQNEVAIFNNKEKNMITNFPSTSDINKNDFNLPTSDINKNKFNTPIYSDTNDDLLTQKTDRYHFFQLTTPEKQKPLTLFNYLSPHSPMLKTNPIPDNSPTLQKKTISNISPMRNTKPIPNNSPILKTESIPSNSPVLKTIQISNNSPMLKKKTIPNNSPILNTKSIPKNTISSNSLLLSSCIAEMESITIELTGNDKKEQQSNYTEILSSSETSNTDDDEKENSKIKVLNMQKKLAELSTSLELPIITDLETFTNFPSTTDLTTRTESTNKVSSSNERENKIDFEVTDTKDGNKEEPKMIIISSDTDSEVVLSKKSSKGISKKNTTKLSDYSNLSNKVNKSILNTPMKTTNTSSLNNNVTHESYPQVSVKCYTNNLEAPLSYPQVSDTKNLEAPLSSCKTSGLDQSTLKGSKSAPNLNEIHYVNELECGSTAWSTSIPSTYRPSTSCTNCSKAPSDTCCLTTATVTLNSASSKGTNISPTSIGFMPFSAGNVALVISALKSLNSKNTPSNMNDCLTNRTKTSVTTTLTSTNGTDTLPLSSTTGIQGISNNILESLPVSFNGVCKYRTESGFTKPKSKPMNELSFSNTNTLKEQFNTNSKTFKISQDSIDNTVNNIADAFLSNTLLNSTISQKDNLKFNERNFINSSHNPVFALANDRPIECTSRSRDVIDKNQILPARSMDTSINGISDINVMMKNVEHSFNDIKKNMSTRNSCAVINNTNTHTDSIKTKTLQDIDTFKANYKLNCTAMPFITEPCGNITMNSNKSDSTNKLSTISSQTYDESTYQFSFSLPTKKGSPQKNYNTTPKADNGKVTEEIFSKKELNKSICKGEEVDVLTHLDNREFISTLKTYINRISSSAEQTNSVSNSTEKNTGVSNSTEKNNRTSNSNFTETNNRISNSNFTEKSYRLSYSTDETKNNNSESNLISCSSLPSNPIGYPSSSSNSIGCSSSPSSPIIYSSSPSNSISISSSPTSLISVSSPNKNKSSCLGNTVTKLMMKLGKKDVRENEECDATKSENIYDEAVKVMDSVLNGVEVLSVDTVINKDQTRNSNNVLVNKVLKSRKSEKVIKVTPKPVSSSSYSSPPKKSFCLSNTINKLMAKLEKRDNLESYEVDPSETTQTESEAAQSQKVYNVLVSVMDSILDGVEVLSKDIVKPCKCMKPGASDNPKPHDRESDSLKNANQKKKRITKVSPQKLGRITSITSQKTINLETDEKVTMNSNCVIRPTKEYVKKRGSGSPSGLGNLSPNKNDTNRKPEDSTQCKQNRRLTTDNNKQTNTRLTTDKNNSTNLRLTSDNNKHTNPRLTTDKSKPMKRNKSNNRKIGSNEDLEIDVENLDVRWPEELLNFMNGLSEDTDTSSNGKIRITKRKKSRYVKKKTKRDKFPSLNINYSNKNKKSKSNRSEKRELYRNAVNVNNINQDTTINQAEAHASFINQDTTIDKVEEHALLQMVPLDRLDLFSETTESCSAKVPVDMLISASDFNIESFDNINSDPTIDQQEVNCHERLSSLVDKESSTNEVSIPNKAECQLIHSQPFENKDGKQEVKSVVNRPEDIKKKDLKQDEGPLFHQSQDIENENQRKKDNFLYQERVAVENENHEQDDEVLVLQSKNEEQGEESLVQGEESLVQEEDSLVQEEDSLVQLESNDIDLYYYKDHETDFVCINDLHVDDFLVNNYNLAHEKFFPNEIRSSSSNCEEKQIVNKVIEEHSHIDQNEELECEVENKKAKILNHDGLLERTEMSKQLKDKDDVTSSKLIGNSIADLRPITQNVVKNDLSSEPIISDNSDNVSILNENEDSVVVEDTEIPSDLVIPLEDKEIVEALDKNNVEAVDKNNVEGVDKNNVEGVDNIDMLNKSNIDTSDKNNIETLNKCNVKTLDKNNIESLNKSNVETLDKSDISLNLDATNVDKKENSAIELRDFQILLKKCNAEKNNPVKQNESKVKSREDDLPFNMNLQTVLNNITLQPKNKKCNKSIKSMSVSFGIKTIKDNAGIRSPQNKLKPNVSSNQNKVNLDVSSNKNNASLDVSSNQNKVNLNESSNQNPAQLDRNNNKSMSEERILNYSINEITPVYQNWPEKNKNPMEICKRSLLTSCHVDKTLNENNCNVTLDEVNVDTTLGENNDSATLDEINIDTELDGNNCNATSDEVNVDTTLGGNNGSATLDEINDDTTLHEKSDNATLDEINVDTKVDESNVSYKLRKRSTKPVNEKPIVSTKGETLLDIIRQAKKLTTEYSEVNKLYALNHHPLLNRLQGLKTITFKKISRDYKLDKSLDSSFPRYLIQNQRNISLDLPDLSTLDKSIALNLNCGNGKMAVFSLANQEITNHERTHSIEDLFCYSNMSHTSKQEVSLTKGVTTDLLNKFFPQITSQMKKFSNFTTSTNDDAMKTMMKSIEFERHFLDFKSDANESSALNLKHSSEIDNDSLTVVNCIPDDVVVVRDCKNEISKPGINLRPAVSKPSINLRSADVAKWSEKIKGKISPLKSFIMKQPHAIRINKPNEKLQRKRKSSENEKTKSETNQKCKKNNIEVERVSIVKSQELKANDNKINLSKNAKVIKLDSKRKTNDIESKRKTNDMESKSKNNEITSQQSKSPIITPKKYAKDLIEWENKMVLKDFSAKRKSRNNNIQTSNGSSSKKLVFSKTGESHDKNLTKSKTKDLSTKCSSNIISSLSNRTASKILQKNTPSKHSNLNKVKPLTNRTASKILQKNTPSKHSNLNKVNSLTSRTASKILQKNSPSKHSNLNKVNSLTNRTASKTPEKNSPSKHSKIIKMKNRTEQIKITKTKALEKYSPNKHSKITKVSSLTNKTAIKTIEKYSTNLKVKQAEVKTTLINNADIIHDKKVKEIQLSTSQQSFQNKTHLNDSVEVMQQKATLPLKNSAGTLSLHLKNNAGTSPQSIPPHSISSVKDTQQKSTLPLNDSAGILPLPSNSSAVILPLPLNSNSVEMKEEKPELDGSELISKSIAGTCSRANSDVIEVPHVSQTKCTNKITPPSKSVTSKKVSSNNDLPNKVSNNKQGSSCRNTNISKKNGTDSKQLKENKPSHMAESKLVTGQENYLQNPIAVISKKDSTSKPVKQFNKPVADRNNFKTSNTITDIPKHDNEKSDKVCSKRKTKGTKEICTEVSLTKESSHKRICRSRERVKSSLRDCENHHRSVKRSSRSSSKSSSNSKSSARRRGSPRVPCFETPNAQFYNRKELKTIVTPSKNSQVNGKHLTRSEIPYRAERSPRNENYRHRVKDVKIRNDRYHTDHRNPRSDLPDKHNIHPVRDYEEHPSQNFKTRVNQLPSDSYNYIDRRINVREEEYRSKELNTRDISRSNPLNGRINIPHLVDNAGYRPKESNTRNSEIITDNRKSRPNPLDGRINIPHDNTEYRSKESNTHDSENLTDNRKSRPNPLDGRINIPHDNTEYRSKESNTRDSENLTDNHKSRPNPLDGRINILAPLRSNGEYLSDDILPPNKFDRRKSHRNNHKDKRNPRSNYLDGRIDIRSPAINDFFPIDNYDRENDIYDKRDTFRTYEDSLRTDNFSSRKDRYSRSDCEHDGFTTPLADDRLLDRFTPPLADYAPEEVFVPPFQHLENRFGRQKHPLEEKNYPRDDFLIQRRRSEDTFCHNQESNCNDGTRYNNDIYPPENERFIGDNYRSESAQYESDNFYPTDKFYFSSNNPEAYYNEHDNPLNDFSLGDARFDLDKRRASFNLNTQGGNDSAFNFHQENDNDTNSCENYRRDYRSNYRAKSLDIENNHLDDIDVQLERKRYLNRFSKDEALIGIEGGSNNNYRGPREDGRNARAENEFNFNNSENRFTDNRAENVFNENRTENRLTDNRTENRFTDNRTENGFNDNRADRRNDNRTENRFTDNRTEIKLTDNRTENRFTDNRTENRFNDNRADIRNDNRADSRNVDIPVGIIRNVDFLPDGENDSNDPLLTKPTEQNSYDKTCEKIHDLRTYLKGKRALTNISSNKNTQANKPIRIPIKKPVNMKSKVLPMFTVKRPVVAKARRKVSVIENRIINTSKSSAINEAPAVLKKKTLGNYISEDFY